LERLDPVPSASIGLAYRSLPEVASLSTRPTPGWKPMFHVAACGYSTCTTALPDGARYLPEPTLWMV
jgi:hypothetical protein